MELYIGSIEDMYDLQGIFLLDERRREHLYRYRRIEDKARCLVAGLMLRRLLGAKGIEDITYGAHGKPLLKGGPCFNLSHSGKLVVLLTDQHEVGVDVEHIEPYPKRVVNRVFVREEKEWFKREATDEAFFRLWTGKEAIMKALGLGFFLTPESFEIKPQQDAMQLIGNQELYLHWLKYEDYMLCMATRQRAEPKEPIFLTRELLLKKQEG